MGELVHLFKGGRPPQTKGGRSDKPAPPFTAAPVTIADLVLIDGETHGDGRPQTGIVQNIVMTPNGVRLWVRRHGGPLAGTTRVLALTEARLAPFPPPFPPSFSGKAPSGACLCTD